MSDVTNELERWSEAVPEPVLQLEPVGLWQSQKVSEPSDDQVCAALLLLWCAGEEWRRAVGARGGARGEGRPAEASAPCSAGGGLGTAPSSLTSAHPSPTLLLLLLLGP